MMLARLCRDALKMGHQLRHSKLWTNVESSIFELWPQGLPCKEPNHLLGMGELIMESPSQTQKWVHPHLHGSIGYPTCLPIKTVKQPPVFLEWNSMELTSHTNPTTGAHFYQVYGPNTANPPGASSCHISKLDNKAPVLRIPFQPPSIQMPQGIAPVDPPKLGFTKKTKTKRNKALDKPASQKTRCRVVEFHKCFYQFPSRPSSPSPVQPPPVAQPNPGSR